MPGQTETTEFLAGSLAKGKLFNSTAIIGITDVPITVPAPGPWSYIKIIVETPDRKIGVAINEAAVLGTVGTPPVPIWGAGDVILGTSTEFQPLVPPLKVGDTLHFIASLASTTITFVLRK